MFEEATTYTTTVSPPMTWQTAAPTLTPPCGQTAVLSTSARAPTTPSMAWRRWDKMSATFGGGRKSSKSWNLNGSNLIRIGEALATRLLVKVAISTTFMTKKVLLLASMGSRAMCALMRIYRAVKLSCLSSTVPTPTMQSDSANNLKKQGRWKHSLVLLTNQCVCPCPIFQRKTAV